MNGWELAAQAIREGLWIRRTDWIHQVRIEFCNQSFRWFYKGGVEADPTFNIGKWEIYTGPKPKVKKYLWARSNKSGDEHKLAFNGEFYSEERLAADKCLGHHVKVAGSMIEVDQ